MQSGNSYAFGLSALRQANDYFFARKRESFFQAFFGVFPSFLVFLCFLGVFFCFSRVRSSAIFFCFLFFWCCSNYFSR